MAITVLSFLHTDTQTYGMTRFILLARLLPSLSAFRERLFHPTYICFRAHGQVHMMRRRIPDASKHISAPFYEKYGKRNVNAPSQLLNKVFQPRLLFCSAYAMPRILTQLWCLHASLWPDHDVRLVPARKPEAVKVINRCVPEACILSANLQVIISWELINSIITIIALYLNSFCWLREMLASGTVVLPQQLRASGITAADWPSFAPFLFKG